MEKGRGRGFASMSPEKKREIASKGGKAAHALGTAHKWTSEEAQAAGRKGGSISRRRSKVNQAQAFSSGKCNFIRLAVSQPFSLLRNTRTNTISR